MGGLLDFSLDFLAFFPFFLFFSVSFMPSLAFSLMSQLGKTGEGELFSSS